MIKYILIILTITIWILLTYNDDARKIYNENLWWYTWKLWLLDAKIDHFNNKIEIDWKKQIIWNISNWKIITDLSWASLSNVACFPATQNKKFNWNMIIYNLLLNKNKKINVKLTPDNIKDNLSLIIYKTDPWLDLLPPNIESVYDCEVDHKWDRPKVWKTQDHTRSLSIQWNTIKSGIYIWVVWANWLTNSNFSLDIEIL